jgi:hypothetical protein
MAIKKSKTNSTFFEDIPKVYDLRDRQRIALEKCKSLSKLTWERRSLQEQYREVHKNIYNLSLEINRLHEEIEEFTKVV